MTYYDYCKKLLDFAQLKISKKEFYKISYENPEYYIKSISKIKASEKLRHSIIKERNLEVVYFTGPSGCGKTTVAKYFSDKLGFDYFVSGTGDDFLDGYDKEECLILDDFRAGSMKFMELLKMLDNNTNSSVHSRYVNKDLSNCKLIILTSVFPPNELYAKLTEEGNKEPKEQLYRRLKHHFYTISEDGEILEKTLKVDDISFTGKSLGNIKEIFSELGIDVNNSKNSSLLDVFKKEATPSKINSAVDIDKDDPIFEILSSKIF